MTPQPVPSPAGDSNPSLGAASRINLDSQSVAGEEDPGASLDMSGVAPEGTPGTGEGLCRECGGSGRAGNATCPSCSGSGKVIAGIGVA